MRYLAEKGYDPSFGARPLKRLIQNEVVESPFQGSPRRDNCATRPPHRNCREGKDRDQMIVHEAPIWGHFHNLHVRGLSERCEMCSVAPQDIAPAIPKARLDTDHASQPVPKCGHCENGPIWVHGTTSSALPLLARTKKLMSSGQLLDQEGLVPMSGEVAHGIAVSGISQLYLSVYPIEKAASSWESYANKKSPLPDYTPEFFLRKLHWLEVHPIDHPEWDAEILSLFRFKQWDPDLFLEELESTPLRISHLKQRCAALLEKENPLLPLTLSGERHIGELVPYRIESPQGKRWGEMQIIKWRALRLMRLLTEKPKVLFSPFERELIQAEFPILFGSTTQQPFYFHEEEGNLLSSQLGVDVTLAYVLPQDRERFIHWLEEAGLSHQITLVREIP